MTQNSLIIKVNEKLVKVVKVSRRYYAGSYITYNEYIDLTPEEEVEYYESRSHCDKI